MMQDGSGDSSRQAKRLRSSSSVEEESDDDSDGDDTFFKPSARPELRIHKDLLRDFEFVPACKLLCLLYHALSKLKCLHVL